MRQTLLVPSPPEPFAAPFERFLDTGDAKPMIRALQKARKWVEAQKKKGKKA